jgi:hypothetical protein
MERLRNTEAPAPARSTLSAGESSSPGLSHTDTRSAGNTSFQKSQKGSEDVGQLEGLLVAKSRSI